jgi:hypothetical protein
MTPVFLTASLLTLACAADRTQQLRADRMTLSSWERTTTMIVRELDRGAVPRRYAARALDAVDEELTGFIREIPSRSYDAGTRREIIVEAARIAREARRAAASLDSPARTSAGDMLPSTSGEGT